MPTTQKATISIGFHVPECGLREIEASRLFPDNDMCALRLGDGLYHGVMLYGTRTQLEKIAQQVWAAVAALRPETEGVTYDRAAD